MADKSRAEYFRERRKTVMQFGANIERSLVEELDRHLKEKGMSRTQWLRAKILEELGK